MHGIREESPSQRDEEGDRRCAPQGRDLPERAVGLAEGDPNPREPAVGGPVAQRLLGDPGKGDDERADAAALKDRTPPAKQTHIQGLTHREPGPRHDPEVDARPTQRRDEEGQPEGQPEAEASAAAHSDGDQREDRDRGRRGPPQPVTGEGQGQHGTTDESKEEAAHRCNRRSARRELRTPLVVRRRRVRTSLCPCCCWDQPPPLRMRDARLLSTRHARAQPTSATQLRQAIPPRGSEPGRPVAARAGHRGLPPRDVAAFRSRATQRRTT